MSWSHEYDPNNPADAEAILAKYHVRVYKEKESDVPCWIAEYSNDTGRGGSSSFFAISSNDSERRSKYGAALLCFLWYEKDVRYPLCRDLARLYFLN